MKNGAFKGWGQWRIGRHWWITFKRITTMARGGGGGGESPFKPPVHTAMLYCEHTRECTFKMVVVLRSVQEDTHLQY